MIIKNIAAIRDTRTAAKWVRYYMEEVAKHKREDIGRLGIQLGQNYFTGRTAGMVTAHGYAKKAVRQVAKRHQLDGNDAILRFVLDHCARQRRKGRNTLGIRMIMSLDPAKIARMAKRNVDVDRLLVRVAEETMGGMADRYFGGDQFGFLLAIRHDAMTNINELGKTLRTNGQPTKPSPPHVHAHLFILPQTERHEQLISFTDPDWPMGDGEFIDMFFELRVMYQHRVRQNIEQILSTPEQVIDPRMVALIRESAASTYEDFQKDESLPVEAFRRFALTRFVYYMRTLNKEKLARHYRKRTDRILELEEETAKNRNAVMEDLTERTTIMKEDVTTSLAGRAEAIQTVINKLKGKPNFGVETWQLDSYRAAIVCTEPELRHLPSQAEFLEKSFSDFSVRRMANRIHMIGNASLLEVDMAAATQDPGPPEWVRELGGMLQSPNPLPNQDMLETEAQNPAVVPIQRVDS